MMHDNPASDPKQIWQNQRRERPTMSVEEIRTRANMAQTKARRSLSLALALSGLLVIFCAIAIVTLSGPPRVITVTMMAVVLAVAYIAYKRMGFPRQLLPDAALTACLQFYRRELELQYRSVALTWRFAIPLTIYGWLTWNVWARSIGPLSVRILLPSLLALILFLRRREARRVKMELDTLDELESGNV
jgi:hypothetical protein